MDTPGHHGPRKARPLKQKKKKHGRRFARRHGAKGGGYSPAAIGRPSAPHAQTFPRRKHRTQNAVATPEPSRGTGKRRILREKQTNAVPTPTWRSSFFVDGFPVRSADGVGAAGGGRTRPGRGATPRAEGGRGSTSPAFGRRPESPAGADGRRDPAPPPSPPDGGPVAVSVARSDGEKGDFRGRFPEKRGRAAGGCGDGATGRTSAGPPGTVRPPDVRPDRRFTVPNGPPFRETETDRRRLVLLTRN